MTRLIDGFEQFFDGAGNPLIKGELNFFESGSSTVRKTTFSDAAEKLPNSNPVILGGDGRAPNVFGSGSYRAILTDADEVQIILRDPIGGDLASPFGADWSATVTYSAVDVVRDDGRYWQSLVNDNLNNQPSSDAGSNWELAVIGLSDVAGVAGQVFATVAAMVAAPSLSLGQKVTWLGYHAAADGGGNTGVVVAAGTGTADGGSFIDVTGLQVQAIFNGPISPKQWGAISDGATDASDANDSMQAYIATKIREVGTVGLSWQSLSDLIVDLTGDYLITRTFVAYPDVNYILPVGSRLLAGTAFMTVVRNADLTERAAATGGPNRYGANGLSFTGGGLIDGGDLARKGFYTETVALASRIEVEVANCTNTATITASGTTGTDTLTLSVGTVGVGDTLQTALGVNEFYTVMTVAGSVITVSPDLDATHTADDLTIRAVGYTGCMTQQSVADITCTVNDVGEVWSVNRDGLHCTDMEVRGMNQNNNIAGIYIALSGSQVYSKTYQQSFDRELVIVGTRNATLYSPYIESINEDAADNDTPPTGGSPVTVAFLVTRPLIDIKGGRNIRFFDIRFPSGTLFRRLVVNSGLDTIIDGITTNGSALPVNPNIPGDFSILEQSTTEVQLHAINLRGDELLTLTADDKIIVDSTGAAAPTFRSEWNVFSNGASNMGGGEQVVRLQNNGIHKQIKRVGESNAHVEYFDRGFKFGDASGAPASELRYRGTQGVGFSFNQQLFPGAGNASIQNGTGNPEGVVAASPGSLFLSDDGNHYRKASGTGNTGWSALS